jgi:hypothetical protein
MSDQPARPRDMAQQAILAIDAFMRSVEGGEGLRSLIEARGTLSWYVQQGALQPGKKSLSVQNAAVGGVTLVRGGQHFVINDDELDLVREQINARKREIRKQERRASR